MTARPGMKSAAQALSWEIWSRGRRSAWAAVGLMIACGVFNAAVPTTPHPFGSREAVLTFLMVVALCLVFWIFHGTEFRPGKDWHGFPYRWFVLPVPTLLLIACPMGLGVLSTELMYLGWSKLVFGPLGVTVPGWLGLILGAGMVSYQAVLWSLAGFRVTRIVVLSVTALVFVNLSFAFMVPDLAPNLSRSIVAWIVVGLAMLGFLGSWFSVERQRRGGGRGRGWFKAAIDWIGDHLPRRTRGFASPCRAQFWYEWRRAGWLLPASIGAALLLVFVPVSWRLRAEADAAWWILGWALALPVLLAAVIGKGFAKPDFWSTDVSLPPFVAVRPLATGDLVVIKMKVAALSSAVGWAMVLAFLGTWLPLWANTADVREVVEDWKFLHGGFSIVAAVALLLAVASLLSWRCLVNGLWLGLSGDKRIVTGALVLNAAALGLGIWGVVFSANHFRSDDLARYVSWLGWALLATVLLKLWGAVFSWKGISRRRATVYALCWLCATGGLVTLALRVCPDIFWLKHLVVLALLLPVPLARLGLAPRALSRNRHRK
jgi:hypothetical protein